MSLTFKGDGTMCLPTGLQDTAIASGCNRGIFKMRTSEPRPITIGAHIVFDEYLFQVPERPENLDTNTYLLTDSVIDKYCLRHDTDSWTKFPSVWHMMLKFEVSNTLDWIGNLKVFKHSNHGSGDIFFENIEMYNKKICIDFYGKMTTGLVFDSSTAGVILDKVELSGYVAYNRFETGGYYG